VNPISAVTQTDPYPFYASLVQHRPMYFDETLGFWIASSAEAVSAVLNSDLCSVRPANQRVPPALIGTVMGQIYPHLIRFDDSPQHCPAKGTVTNALDSLQSARVSERAAFWAQKLVVASRSDIESLDALRFKLPVYVVADLLGASPELLPRMVLWTRTSCADLRWARRRKHSNWAMRRAYLWSLRAVKRCGLKRLGC